MQDLIYNQSPRESNNRNDTLSRYYIAMMKCFRDFIDGVSHVTSHGSSMRSTQNGMIHIRSLISMKYNGGNYETIVNDDRYCVETCMVLIG